MPPNMIVLDTNLLVLLIVGTASPSYITRHRRLQTYSDSDFTLLVNLISSAPAIIVTPNTLTETSNLMRYIAEPARTHICEIFRMIVKLTEERYLESSHAVEQQEFLRLGLTDAVLLAVANESNTLLTADLDLYLAAVGRGFNAVNFNYCRVL